MLTDADDAKLAKINKHLAAVIRRASLWSEFRVIEGIRTPARQAELLKAGATKTLNSRHLTGHAVDIAPLVNGKIRWDWPLFYPMADAVKRAAKELDCPVTWGGDWKSFKDGPHFELPWDEFPK